MRCIYYFGALYILLWCVVYITLVRCTYYSDDGKSTIKVDQSIVNGRVGTFYVSFSPLQPGMNALVDNVSDYGDILEPNATYSYSIRSNTIGCYFFDEQTSSMSTDGCTVGHLHYATELRCLLEISALFL